MNHSYGSTNDEVFERLHVAVRELPLSDAERALTQVNLQPISKTSQVLLTMASLAAPTHATTLRDSSVLSGRKVNPPDSNRHAASSTTRQAASRHSEDGLLYNCDYYYPQEGTQADVFESIGKELVARVLEGVSCNCIAMGLARTGKTHTLFGSLDELGLIQKTMYHLFEEMVDASSEINYTVTFAYWEMSCNAAEDALAHLKQAVNGEMNDDQSQENASGAHRRDQLKLTRSPINPDNIIMSGVTRVPVSSWQDCDELLLQGNAYRIHRAEQRQARWHGFVQLTVTSVESASNANKSTRTLTFAHLKGPESSEGQKPRSAVFREVCQLNKSISLFNAASIHSLDYREKRMHLVKSDADHRHLILRSQFFFMSSLFSHWMAQLVSGMEACFVIGCVGVANYNGTVETLEQLEALRGLTCCANLEVTTTEEERLRHRIAKLEATQLASRNGGRGETEALDAGSDMEVDGRPLYSVEEKIVALRRQLRRLQTGGDDSMNDEEAWDDPSVMEAKLAEEAARQRFYERHGADVSGERSAASSRQLTPSLSSEVPPGRRRDEGAQSTTLSQASRSHKRPAGTLTHGDRKRILLDGHTKDSPNTYEGQWSNGVFDGFGIHITARERYEGEFEGGLRHGTYGVLWVRKDPSKPWERVYRGGWSHGKRDGRGNQWKSDGEVYDGEFSNKARHGVGRLYLPNGDVYEGQFRYGVREGWGTLTVASSGDRFEGQWADDKREGPGIWYYLSRMQLYRGEWHENTAVFGTFEDMTEKTTNECSSFIPAVELVDLNGILRQERDKLNQVRAMRPSASLYSTGHQSLTASL